jgi:MOSC domain-containing protein YiiM
VDGRIFQLNCSKGGVPKTPVPESRVTETGLECDRQAHRLIHGGPERALCLYSLELIQELQAEGHPVFPGSTGENVTITGLDWTSIVPGARLALGDEVLVEVTGFASPCKSIAGSFRGGEFKRISNKIFPGSSRAYVRVLRTGRLAAGQPVKLLNNGGPAA